MNTRIAVSSMFFEVAPVHSGIAVSNGPVSYIIGGIISLLILGYLIYTLMHPEKF
jgi:K+-transporting ATPase KdpF subunit